MTNQIDMINLFVKDKGYTLSVNFKAGPDRQRPASIEHAYSNLDDLQVGIADLLDPAPVTIGVDLAKPGSDMTVTALMHRNSDGTIETVAIDDDDGWREWESHLLKGREIPPGVTLDSIVEVQFRNAPNFTSRAGSIIWFHDARRRDTDVIAYRVVKP